MDRAREPRLVLRRAQPPFLLRIRDERGLDQHRWNVRRLQHHEARLLHLAALELADAIEFMQHFRRRVEARRDARGLRQVEQHRGQHLVLVVERHATHEVGRVFLLGEPARRLAARAAQGQHVDGGTASRRDCATASAWIGHEQIGLLWRRAMRPRSRSATNWSPSRVSTARMPDSALMMRTSSRATASVTSFLARARATDGARILAAVPGIDGDHEIAQRLRPVRAQRPPASARRRGLRDGRCAQVHHQTMPLRTLRFGTEAPGLESARFSSTTRRTVRCGCLPSRTVATGPAPSGSRRRRALNCAFGISTTTRAGSSSVNRECTAGPDRSSTMRALSPAADQPDAADLHGGHGRRGAGEPEQNGDQQPNGHDRPDDSGDDAG